jgi:hypothetical protein
MVALHLQCWIFKRAIGRFNSSFSALSQALENQEILKN